MSFWPSQGRDVLVSPWYQAFFLFAAFLLFRRLQAQALPWVLLGLTGVLMMVAHPVASQWDRLIMPMWLPVACAFGYAAATAINKPRAAEARRNDEDLLPGTESIVTKELSKVAP